MSNMFVMSIMACDEQHFVLLRYRTQGGPTRRSVEEISSDHTHCEFIGVCIAMLKTHVNSHGSVYLALLSDVRPCSTPSFALKSP